MDAGRRCLARCAERWPGVVIDDAAFLARVREQGRDLSDDRLDDLWLAHACAEGDAQALLALERDVVSRARAAVRRIDPRPEFADEVLQALRERLLVGPEPRIQSYRGDGALVGWVTVAAIRTALNLRKRNAHPIHGDRELATFISDADTMDVELEAFKAQHRDAFRAAFRAACKELSGRDRTVLRLVLVEGLSLSDLARLFGVHRSNATRWAARARESLRAATRARLKSAQGLDSLEADQVERYLHSQLSVTFSRSQIDLP